MKAAAKAVARGFAPSTDSEAQVKVVILPADRRERSRQGARCRCRWRAGTAGWRAGGCGGGQWLCGQGRGAGCFSVPFSRGLRGKAGLQGLSLAPVSAGQLLTRCPTPHAIIAVRGRRFAVARNFFARIVRVHRRHGSDRVPSMKVKVKGRTDDGVAASRQRSIESIGWERSSIRPGGPSPLSKTIGPGADRRPA